MKLADLKKHGFDWNSILDFCRKNIRYISAGIIVVILIIVLAVTAGNEDTKDKESKDGNAAQESVLGVQWEDFEVDAISEVNTLIKNYYTAYAAGDITAIETYATPISDTEKSYITLMSQYVSEYKNIQCNTKAGLAEDEYAVSVEMDMYFENVETGAPGLDFFYVRKNEEGAYYIDNIYSQFNLQNQEQTLDSQIETFIEEYEMQEDMLALYTEVDNRYNEALAADENLKNMVDTTIPQALQAWVAEITGASEQVTEDGKASGEQPTEDGKASGEQPTGDGQASGEQPTEEQQDTKPEEEIQAVTEEVYVTENVNIRKEPGESAEKVGNAVAGQSFTRTGTTGDGWSEIEYDGAKAYIKSEYISTEKPEIEDEDSGLNYVPEGSEITLNSAMNVRRTMSEDGDLMGTAQIGDTVEVVLSYAEGWTKVKWNGKTGYIKTELLVDN